MPRRPVVLLPGFDRNRQAIVFRRKRAGGIGCHRAGRAVSAVEVEYDAVTGGRGSLQKATTGIGLMLAGQVINMKNSSFGSSSIIAVKRSSCPLHGNTAVPAIGVAITSPSTFGTSTVRLPSDAIHFAVMRY